MKLKNYIKNLQQLVEENPKYNEIDVIFAKDDEGNGFGHIGFAPSLGNFNEDKEFTQVENFEDIDEDNRIVNAVCIN